jgi:hypothetical protein
MSTKPLLWCIHIPGPDDLIAAPSKAAAEHMAANHNAAMNSYYDNHDLGAYAPSRESVLAVVIEWPGGSEEEHAEALKKFDADEWGWVESAA